MIHRFFPRCIFPCPAGTLGLVALLMLLCVSAHGKTPAPETDSWPFFRGDGAQRGVANSSIPSSLTLRWTAKTDGAILGSAVVDQKHVYVGSTDGHLYCLNRATGEPVWKHKTGDAIEGAPMLLDTRVFVGSTDGYLYALHRATGKEIWKSKTEGKIIAAPTAHPIHAPQRILVGDYSGVLSALDPKTGAPLWRYPTGSYIYGTPAVDGDSIILGGCDGFLHQIHAKDGKVIKTFPVGNYIGASVAIHDGHAYFGDFNNRFRAMNLASSQTVWEHRGAAFPFLSSAAISGDLVVAGGRDKLVHCWNIKTGEEHWAFPARGRVDSSPVIGHNRVVVGSDDGKLYLLRLEDGEPEWTYDIGQPIVASPAVVNQWVYVGSKDGSLYAFGPGEK